MNSICSSMLFFTIYYQIEEYSAFKVGLSITLCRKSQQYQYIIIKSYN